MYFLSRKGVSQEQVFSSDSGWLLFCDCSFFILIPLIGGDLWWSFLKTNYKVSILKICSFQLPLRLTLNINTSYKEVQENQIVNKNEVFIVRKQVHKRLYKGWSMAEQFLQVHNTSVLKKVTVNTHKMMPSS